MSTSTGLQRVVQLFWDKDLENEDDLNPIVVLGRTYDSHLHCNQRKSSDQAQSVVPLDQEQQQDHTTNESDTFQNLQKYFQRLKLSSSSQTSTSPKVPPEWPQEFIQDIYTRIWLTYRTKFPPIPRDPEGPSPLTLHNFIRGQTNDLNNDHFTTDCGWGCMIRTGQTLLANALMDLRLGRDYRFELEDSNTQNQNTHDEIVSLFIDDPLFPFSIHNIVQKGKILSGKKAGEWFGPSATARSIQALCSENEDTVGLKAYIGSDSGDIYEKDVFKTALGENGETFRPVLILLGVRLGVDNINSLYWSSLKDLLNMPQSVGISGGRPSSSHYFFGYQGDYFLYLDPHVPQPSLKIDTEYNKDINPSELKIPQSSIQTVHTKKLRKIHLSEIDPSMLIGFLIKDEEQWWDFKRRIQNPENKNKIIHISPDESPEVYSDRKPSFVVIDNDSDDFIDVGLEYGEIQEEMEYQGAETEDKDDIVTISKRSSVEDEEPALGSPVNRSLVVVDDEFEPVSSEIKQNEDELAETPEICPSPPQQLELSETTGSFENYSNSIKDDYENISAALGNEKLQEEPCLIEKEDAIRGETELEDNTWVNEDIKLESDTAELDAVENTTSLDTIEVPENISPSEELKSCSKDSSSHV
ncbi:hypothetical protein WICPIJ_009364 [Wickerhamomyces pijperi]|uniref:Cysteine protease n=1 Tax=Wickerhamomyces pijperi TaxID=599730 RepID=A0A9P8TD54_WICPI|nr:hypothetical protein WICPIJ_009364 [Wickerhamomyces pijperi]